MPNRGSEIVDVLQSLDQQEAIKLVRVDDIRRCQVGDDGRVTIGSIKIDHVRPDDLASEAVRVTRVADLKYSAPYIPTMLLQKAIDVEAI